MEQINNINEHSSETSNRSIDKKSKPGLPINVSVTYLDGRTMTSNEFHIVSQVEKLMRFFIKNDDIDMIRKDPSDKYGCVYDYEVCTNSYHWDKEFNGFGYEDDS